MVRTYNLVQQRAWGLLVADPEEMYDRENDRKLEMGARETRGNRSRAMSRRVSPTFAEMRRSMNE
jgi:hypothetical protein